MLWRLGSFVQYAAQYHHAPQTCDKLRLVSQYHLPTPHTHISYHQTMIYNLPGRILAGNTFLKILYFFVGIVIFCRIDSLATGGETVWQKCERIGWKPPGRNVRSTSCFFLNKVASFSSFFSSSTKVIRFFYQILYFDWRVGWEDGSHLGGMSIEPQAIFPQKKK